jgi:hypothetical protein
MLGSVIAMTWQNAVELDFRKKNPYFPDEVDVAQIPGDMKGYSDENRRQFLQVMHLAHYPTV